MADVDSAGRRQILGPAVRRSFPQTERQRFLLRSFFNPRKLKLEEFIHCSKVNKKDWLWSLAWRT
jgi:hypothetical protein